MAKLPSFQFYPGDWRKDPGVQSLSFHDRGVWLEILCLMHESQQRGKLLLNGVAMPDEALARLLGVDKQILVRTLSTLVEYGVATRDPDGSLVCRRMVRDENLRTIRQEAGKLGGNPILLNQNSTTEVKQNSTPSSSSSVSASAKKEKIKKEKVRAGPFVKPTPQQVEEYARSIGVSVNGWKFCDSYETKGWVIGVGKIPMKSWEAAVRTWARNAKEWAQTATAAQPTPVQRERDRLADLKAMRSVWKASGLSLCHGKRITGDADHLWCEAGHALDPKDAPNA